MTTPIGRFSFRRCALVAYHFSREAEYLSRALSAGTTLGLLVRQRRRSAAVRRVRLLDGPTMFARVGIGQTDVHTLVSIWGNAHYCPLEVAGGSVIIDAGANVGYSAVWFATRFPTSRVVAIEPDADNVALLRRNTAPYPNISVVHTALGAKAGTTRLLDPGDGAWGFRTWEADDQARADHDMTPRGTVEVLSVGDLIDQYSLDRVGLVKIDIEGAELEVFEHAATWIANADAVMVELHDRFRPGCRDAFIAATETFDEHFESGENSFAVQSSRCQVRR
jgi:FkbM family methyltransferase